MTEDEKILQAEFEKRWKRSPQKEAACTAASLSLCLAQALYAPDFPFVGLDLRRSALSPWRLFGRGCAGGIKRKGFL